MRRDNRVRSVQGSLAIEGNTLIEFMLTMIRDALLEVIETEQVSEQQTEQVARLLAVLGNAPRMKNTDRHAGRDMDRHGQARTEERARATPGMSPESDVCVCPCLSVFFPNVFLAPAPPQKPAKLRVPQADEIVKERAE